MTREALCRSWRKRIAAFERGNLSQREWCRRNGLALHQFTYWKRRLAQENALPPAPVRWSAVRVAPANDPVPPAVSGTEPEPVPGSRFAPVSALVPVGALVSVGAPVPMRTGVAVCIGRARIELEPGFDAATLRVAVAALEAMPC